MGILMGISWDVRLFTGNQRWKWKISIKKNGGLTGKCMKMNYEL
jgi:hypothetical protein